MKKIKNLYKALLVLFVVAACTDELRDVSFVDSITKPSNIAVSFDITQDNSGTVTITPSAESAANFDVYFGDATTEPSNINIGENVEHVYAEGTYDVKIVAYNVKDDALEFTQSLVVSFRAPENLVVTLENDAAISKQVNVSATADFATMFDFYPGVSPTETPISGNIGETVSYVYADAGNYDMKVVAKGGAIATTEYTENFEVTEILAPTQAAPTPAVRNDADVISIFSDAYTNVTLSELPTGWSATGFEATTVDSDNIWKLTSLDFLGMVTNYATGIDVSAMETLHVDYWVPSGTTNELLVKIVNTVDGGEDIESLGTTVGGSWQSIDIDMTGFDGGDLANKEKITQILIDSDGIAGVVYIDNFYFYKAPSSIVTSAIQDFEGTAPGFTSFGNASAGVISNPDASGANTTANVVEFVKPSGAETWAGAYFDVSTPVDVTNFNKISIKTWSPKTGATVRLKLENSADGNQFYEVDATTTVANTWEELTFDVSTAQDFTYDRVVVFFDFTVAGDGTTYYYDEIFSVNDSGVVAPLIFQDFEGAAPTFTSFGSAGTGVIANPDASGANTSANVAEFVKPSGAETWAGSYFDVSTPLDLTTYSKMSIKTWTPKAGITVRLKIENSADNTQFFEVDANPTSVDSWEELTFDLSGADAFNYDRVVIFFDWDVSGDGTTYYYDEFTLTN